MGKDDFEANRIVWRTFKGRPIPIVDGEVRFDLLDASWKIENAKNAQIQRSKIERYLLDPEKKHFREFEDVGYVGFPDQLEKDLLAAVSENFIVSRRRYASAYQYRVDAMLGITKKKNFATVWRVDDEDGIPRFVTAYRKESV